MSVKIRDRGIFIWLCLVFLSILLIVVIGGVTRLTGSGLSMVEWRPVYGILPPMSDGEWNRVFDLYQKTPEFIRLNFDMNLEGFKKIFFWEYLHRILGRLIGLLIIVPSMLFWGLGRLSKTLKWQSVVMIMLVAAQGLMGWYMVKSGLVSRLDVSHYRLAAHLSLAYLLAQWVVWMAWGQLTFLRSEGAIHSFKWGLAVWVWGVIAVQIVWGAFTAGLNAGFGFNTFPKMGDRWLPDSAWVMQPWWRNGLENPVMVQFCHRTLAWVVLISVLFYVWQVLKCADSIQRVMAYCLLGMTTLQFGLGVMTLLSVVEIRLAVLHQVVALFLLTAATISLLRARPCHRSKA